MVVPMLRDLELDFAGRTFTADALLTQRKLADFLRRRGAHFLFTAKDNQPTLLDDLRACFDNRGEPDFREPARLEHGRVESRAIWTTARLNGHPTFPHVGQAFLVERTAVDKKTGRRSVECALGITSHAPDTADAERLLELNRGHWKIESVHNILDNTFDEDRLRIRAGHGPENTTRLRRLAIGVVRARGNTCVAAATRRLNRNMRLVFDYLRMTKNSLGHPSTPHRPLRTN
ncbi:MAG: ISAs1 family transposase [Acidobacteria bacterium]|nr:ISAs1 family transposase [Acidobacteriota bacterium]